MSINSISSMINNRLRFSGLSSGLDTDSIIEQLMRIERIKLERVEQEKKILEWKRDDYRDITNLLRGFRDEYFDVLNSSTNFRSSSAFAVFDTTSSDTSVLTVTAGSGANTGAYDVTVSSLAESAIKEGTSGVSNGYSGLTGANTVDMTKMKEGKEFTLTLDGVTKTITLDQDYTGFTASNFATALEGLIDNAFGVDKINVTESGGYLTLTPTTTSSTLSIGDSVNTYLTTLGFTNGQSNSLTSSAISDFSGGDFKITIDSGTAVTINVTGASDRATLLTNINSALTTAGVDSTVKAIADPESTDKIKFVTLDTTKEVTFTSGDTNDMLTKIGIGSGSKINPMNGNIDYSVSDIGRDFYITIDGTQHHIDLEYDYTSDTDTDLNGRTLAQEIQSQLDSGGATGVTVSISGGKLSFSNPNGYEVKVEKGDDGLKDELGFSSTQDSSRINLSDTLEDVDLATPFTFDAEGNLSFTINGETFTANRSETLNDVIDRINASDTGVKIQYNSLEDKFVLESKSTGSTAVIDNSDITGNFFAALKLDTTTEARGTNATLTIDGISVERTTNNFTIDGVNYDLKGVGTSTVTIESDPDALIDKIKGFVNKYNEVIDKINEELSEERFRDYLPLTEEQKKAMTEKDIELWEEKARSGLLRGDSILQDITDSMRKALYDDVEDVDLSLYEIGITTSSNYEDRGKLVINEEKLRQAIEDYPDKITDLFTKESDISYNDFSNRATRYSEEGLAQRLYDIIQDNIRTTRDDNGKKGILLEKAGIEGDITQFNSSLVEEIEKKDDLIDTLLEEYYEKQESYYAKFTAMERMLNQMNSQSAWLSQQLGQGE